MLTSLANFRGWRDVSLECQTLLLYCPRELEQHLVSDLAITRILDTQLPAVVSLLGKQTSHKLVLKQATIAELVLPFGFLSHLLSSDRSLQPVSCTFATNRESACAAAENR